MTTNSTDNASDFPEEGKAAKTIRGALQIASGAVPVLGGLLSAIAGAWSEREQAKVNQFFDQWVHMLEEEIREKEATVIEIMARLDLQNEKIAARVESREFRSLVKKTFRDLSMGSVIRQHRETDYYGNFIAKPAVKRGAVGSSKVLTSAFDEEDLYELTELGQQFVHYAMTELTPRIAYTYTPSQNGGASNH